MIEHETVPPCQVAAPDGTSLLNRCNSNTTAIDRRSITGSTGSELTTSSCDFNVRSHATSSGTGLVQTESRASVEKFSDNNLSQRLQIESFVSQQVPPKFPGL